jgi:hypothetical protein
MPLAEVVARENLGPDERGGQEVDDLAREIDLDRLDRDAELARPARWVAAAVPITQRT